MKYVYVTGLWLAGAIAVAGEGGRDELKEVIADRSPSLTAHEGPKTPDEIKAYNALQSTIYHCAPQVAVSACNSWRRPPTEDAFAVIHRCPQECMETTNAWRRCARG